MPTTCTPQSVYGPYYQTRFCGASVMNFTVTAGWNEQSSELTVNLVEDCSTVNKRIQYGIDLEATVVTDADEFTEPPVGCPVYFRIGDSTDDEGAYVRNPEGGFEFSGLIQSWNRKNDTNGNPTYTVKITDPRVILENSHIIVSELSESVFVTPPDLNRGQLATPNIINAYAWLEALGRNCPMEVIGGEEVVGSLTGGFGISGVNQRGMRWNTLKGALGVLLCSADAPVFSTLGVSSDKYSPYGRLLYRGAGIKVSESGKPLIPGCGVLGMTPLDPGGSGTMATYMVDLTEIPFAPEHYRITGPLISFTELITQVCKAAGCDYYIELLPVKGLTGVTLVIKVRVVKRSLQPTLGEIEKYVDSQDFVVSKTFGHELAGQSNSSFIFGAPRQDYIQQTKGSVTAELNVIPHPGWNAEGDPQVVTYDAKYGSTAQWWWYLDFRQINNSTLQTVFPADFGWVSETELLLVLGNYDVWIDYEVLKIDQSSETPLAVWLESLYINKISGPIYGSAIKKGLSVATGGGGAQSDPLTSQSRDAMKMYNWLRTFAQEYYGRKFLVKVPNVCRAYNYEQPSTAGYRGSPYYSDDPATDGGWPQKASVLGLTRPSAQLDIFAADDGKILPILKFYDSSNKLVTSDLQPGTFVTAGNTVWAKCDIEEKWLVGYPYALWSPETAWAQLTAPGMITTRTPNTAMEEDRAFLSKLDPTLGTLGGATSAKVGGESRNQLTKKQVGFISDPGSLPIQAGVPVKSNTRCYGPWGNIAIAGTNNDLFKTNDPVAGNLHVENDDSLSPWGYGSSLLMDEAGKSKVKLTTTEMQVVERGQITVPGYPNKRVGSALNTTDTSSYDMNLSTDSYREFVFFKIDLVPAEGLASNAASISTVNVSISTQGVQTEYTLTTFTPVYGRFADANASRLKRIGQNSLAAGRARRAMAARRSFLGRSSLRSQSRSQAIFGGRNPHSATLWLGGKIITVDGVKRTEVIANSADGQSYYGDAFDDTAMMSFDGLVRPVSKYGDGSLPQYVTPGDPCTKSHSVAPPPPHKSYTPLVIKTLFLDPMANKKDGTLQPVGPADYSAGTEIGHDVDEVARGTLESIGDLATGNSGSIDMRHGRILHQRDYRFMALKGPLMVHGWGYDLHGHPVPNDGADGGSIASTYTSCNDEFTEGWLQDPLTWPVAPVDLKYDRERGVWTTDPGYRMYKVKADEEIRAGQQGDATVENDGDVATDSKTSDKVTINNITCSPIPKGCDFMAYYNTAGTCEYWPVHPGIFTIKESPYCVAKQGGSPGNTRMPFNLPSPNDITQWIWEQYTEFYEDVIGGSTGGGKDANSCRRTNCLDLGWGLEIENYTTDSTKIRSPFYVTSKQGKTICTTEGTDSDESLSEKTNILPGYETPTVGANSSTLTNTIVVGNNLTLTRQGCTVTIDAESCGGGGGSISCGTSEECADLGCPDSIQKIEWGFGLEVQKPDSTTARVHKVLSFGDATGESVGDYIEHVTLGCGLKVASSDTVCETDNTLATIAINNTSTYHGGVSTPSHDVKVVCGITCSAQGLEVLEKVLVFSECGLFMGTKWPGGKLNNDGRYGDGEGPVPIDVPCNKPVSSATSEPTQANVNVKRP